jgi:hypothetical protein
VDSLRGYESEGWAHFAFTRINIEPTILRKKIEDLREVGATSLKAAAFLMSFDSCRMYHASGDYYRSGRWTR